jgi:hypothetical protein
MWRHIERAICYLNKKKFIKHWILCLCFFLPPLPLNFANGSIGLNSYVSNTLQEQWGPPWSHDIWKYNYLCNQCPSPLNIWVWILFMAWSTHTILCDKVCQWLATCQWFSPGTPVSSTDCQHITEILLKVALKPN